MDTYILSNIEFSLRNTDLKYSHKLHIDNECPFLTFKTRLPCISLLLFVRINILALCDIYIPNNDVVFLAAKWADSEISCARHKVSALSIFMWQQNLFLNNIILITQSTYNVVNFNKRNMTSFTCLRGLPILLMQFLNAASASSSEANILFVLSDDNVFWLNRSVLVCFPSAAFSFSLWAEALVVTAVASCGSPVRKPCPSFHFWMSCSEVEWMSGRLHRTRSQIGDRRTAALKHLQRSGVSI